MGQVMHRLQLLMLPVLFSGDAWSYSDANLRDNAYYQLDYVRGIGASLQVCCPGAASCCSYYARSYVVFLN